MNRSSKQAGAALLVSLMLIFIMSTLGISAMRSATMENKMVGNAYAKDLTFQAAESATDFVLQSDANLEVAICNPDAITTTVTELTAGNRVSTKVDVRYGGEAVLLDYSLDSVFSSVRFTAVGTSSVTGTPTHTTIGQGATLIGPKSMTAGCQ